MRYLLAIGLFLAFPHLVNGTEPRGAANALNEHTILPQGESVAFLTSLANDPSNSQEVRARAVFTLFGRHIQPGSSASEVHDVLTDTAWLKENNLKGVRILGGWVPVEFTAEDTIFSIALFPADSAGGWSPWVIYLRLSGHIQDEEALKFLRGAPGIGRIKLLEFALCFPSPPNQTGRIEMYTPKGLRILHETGAHAD